MPKMWSDCERLKSMRGSNLFRDVLLGELSVSASIPIPAGVADVGHTASSFCEITLIWPEGILLKSTGVEVPGKWICWLAVVQLPEVSNPVVHKADRSPLRNAALGTRLPLLAALPCERIPW